MLVDAHGMPLRSTGRLRPQTVRAFDAGRAGRRLRAMPVQGTPINDLIRAYGPTVLARSRHLAVNNGYAAAAKEEFVSALAGAGIVPSPLIDDTELRKELQEVWREWTDEADADGLTDFYGLQALVAGEMFEAGEVFLRFRPRRLEDGLVVPLQIQLLPSEMLPLTHNEDLGNGRRVEMGIEFDGIGRRRAYHFRKRHPGATSPGLTSDIETTVVPADEVLHLFKPFRVGQIRGVPHTVSAIATLALLDLYDDAELERKRTAALFGAFVTSPEEEEDPIDAANATAAADDCAVIDPTLYADVDWSLEPGASVGLRPGQDVKFAEPADVGGSYEPFQYRNLLRVASGFGVPYAAMTGDLRQTSYGSLRGGMVQYRRRIDAMQHHVMVYQFCRPVWARWLEEAVLAGAFDRLNPTSYMAQRRALRRVEWIPPKWDWIDPLKDLEAEILAVQNNLKPRSDVIKAQGLDPEDVDRRIAADRAREDALGIRRQPETGAPMDDDEDDDAPLASEDDE